MALTLVEGFKYLPHAASRFTMNNAASGVSTWTRVAGRSAGCYALRHTHSTATGTNSGYLRIPTHNQTFSIGFAALHPNVVYGAVSASSTGVVVVADGRNPFFMASLAVGWTPMTGSSGTSSASSTASMDSSVITPGWHWWNLVGMLGQASGGYVRLYRDGVLSVEMAPDTLVSSSTPGEYVMIFMGNAASTTGIDVSDLIVRNDANLIPDTRVDVLAPTSDIAAGWARSAGSTNYSLVDDAGPTLDTSDYVSADATGLLDTYGVADLPVNPAVISAIGVHAIGRKDGAGNRWASVMMNSAEGTQMDAGSYGITYHYWEYASESAREVPVNAVASATYQAELAARAYDGDTSTAWSAGGPPPQWIYFDFGTAKVITRIELFYPSWVNGSPATFSFDSSDNASTWVSRYTGGLQPYGWTAHTIAGGTSARYWRYNGLTTSGQWMGLNEIRFYTSWAPPVTWTKADVDAMTAGIKIKT